MNTGAIEHLNEAVRMITTAHRESNKDKNPWSGNTVRKWLHTAITEIESARYLLNEGNHEGPTTDGGEGTTHLPEAG